MVGATDDTPRNNSFRKNFAGDADVELPELVADRDEVVLVLERERLENVVQLRLAKAAALLGVLDEGARAVALE